MKKLLLSTLLAFFALQINAQICNPYQPTVAGAKSYLLPDSATGLKAACPGQPYEQIINIKVFKDTSVLAITAVTDSAVINLDAMSIGLPSYLTITSVPAPVAANAFYGFKHMTLRGDSMGCVKISGTVPAGTAPGTTPLSIEFKVRAKILTFIDTSFTSNYTSYKYVVSALGTGTCFGVGVNETIGNIDFIEAVPNPTSQNLNINIQASKQQNVSVTLCNIYGQVVATKNGTLQNGNNTFVFNVANLPQGIYTYTISNGKNKVTNKFIKN